ncbi:hypothetical protein QYE76_019621 [Lolium multiflorum]|uniref:SIAH-type domain-containing protein n=1 Tax=Lolium multiflorum TaxID=4521 RepID=A0AAD8VP97_LOLMU|nr:hypothetical protein QYE76_019621 [Lolium multiflorum]
MSMTTDATYVVPCSARAVIWAVGAAALAPNPCKKCEQPAWLPPSNRSGPRLPPSNRSGAMVKCVGCQSLVASTESYKHYIACPHGPCGCTEAINTGCSFTGPPRELLVHLQASHSIPVFTFQYGIPAWCIVRVLVQPRGHLFIGSGEEDGSVFAITVGALGPTTIVSCVCIRSAACLFPMYKAQLVIGPPAPAGTSDLSTDTLMAVIEPTSSPTPSSIMLQQLTSFLAVPPRYAKQNGGQRVLPICVCINKKLFGLPCVLCCDPADKPWAVFKEDLPVHNKCKLLPLDRFSYDGLMPHGKDEKRAGANGDWIAMVGPEDDKKHRVEENSILSDDKGEMACQSFKPPTPPLSMETDATGPAGAASVEPLVNGVVPREFSELEQDGLPIVKTDVTGADAGVATDDPAPEVATPPEGGFVLVEPVMTMPTVLTGGGPGAGMVEPLAKGVVSRESSEVDIGGLPSVDTGVYLELVL